MAVTILFALMLLVMLMRVFLPKGMKVTGKKTLEVNLSFVERMIYQRLNLYAIGAVLVLMTVTGSIANGFQLLIIMASQAILMVPVKVVLTTEGVALNNVLFRPLSDFARFSTDARHIVLHGQDGARSLSIPVLAEHQKELVLVLGRRLSRKARKEASPGKQVTVG